MNPGTTRARASARGLALALIGWMVVGAEAQVPVPAVATAWDRVVMEAAFNRIDLNEDGTLSMPEVLRLAAMADRFDSLDADRDGTLSLEEFAPGYAAVQ
jgi:EF hand